MNRKQTKKQPSLPALPVALIIGDVAYTVRPTTDRLVFNGREVECIADSEDRQLVVRATCPYGELGYAVALLIDHETRHQGRRRKRGSGGDWIDQSLPMSDGGMLSRRVPRVHMPTVAQLGMVAFSSVSSEHGQIVAMTKQVCVLRMEDGRDEALTWCEVALECVVPDPAQVAPNAVAAA